MAEAWAGMMLMMMVEVVIAAAVVAAMMTTMTEEPWEWKKATAPIEKEEEKQQ